MLDDVQRNRALGSVIAAATGDALGAPYEFQPPVSPDEEITMRGGGILGWDPGEWTDDTSMAIVLLEAAADLNPRDEMDSAFAQDAVAQAWYTWSVGANDIGRITSDVIARAAELGFAAGRHIPHAQDFRDAAAEVAAVPGMGWGSGSVVRTHAVALYYLERDDADLVRAARALSALTHADPVAMDASALWSLIIKHTILTGQIDVRYGLRALEGAERELWERRVDEAEENPPGLFARNGWVVQGIQAAISSVHRAGPVPEERFTVREWVRTVLENAIRGGYDTDTIAALAGALAGAATGYKSVDPVLRRELFGWPGYTWRDLLRTTERAIETAEHNAGARQRAATATAPLQSG